MADNITVLDSASASKTLGTKDLAGVHLPKHVIVDSAGAFVPAPLDDDEYVGSQITIDVFHYAVHAALGFTASTYAASGDQYICFTTPDSETYLHLLWAVQSEGNARLDIYSGVTAGVGGSDQIAYNTNRAAVDGGGASAVLAGNTATAGSVQVGIDWTGGTVINPQGFFVSKTGGAASATFEHVLEKNTAYGFHLVDISSGDLGMTLTWFEVPHL